MANNRLYLWNVDTGLAVMVGKNMGYCWYGGNTDMGAFFDAVEKLWLSQEMGSPLPYNMKTVSESDAVFKGLFDGFPLIVGLGKRDGPRAAGSLYNEDGIQEYDVYSE